ncbi:MAG TPA: hypothetical protein ENK23_07280, partial [Sorangium sp.]|nr:hypothetical protein [Sorangium sp.]
MPPAPRLPSALGPHAPTTAVAPPGAGATVAQPARRPAATTAQPIALDETLPETGASTPPPPVAAPLAKAALPARRMMAAGGADRSGAFAEVTPFMADRAFPQLPRAPKVTARAAPRPKVSHVELSPLLYRAALFGPLAGVVVAGAYATVASVPAIPIAIAAALLVFVAGVQLSLVYHMWAAIRDEHTPLQPRTAALLLLLPLFNVYWAFRVLPGYATAYNAFTARYLLRLPRLSQNLILASMVVPVFGVAI